MNLDGRGWEIRVGDAIERLRELPAEFVDCVVTSPPYWGLRDYGTGEWEGGDESCDHREQKGGEGQASAMQNTSAGTQALAFRAACAKCGATRTDRQLGLEATPEEFVAKMVNVFREVRRVLRDDGTCWVNLGDTYNAYNAAAGPSSSCSEGSASDTQRPQLKSGYGLLAKGLKPKDLCGIPWRVAFALQADGWYLRSDIIWAKPNPMPESVTDRPTKSHEYVFLLSKSRRYFFDADAVREAHAAPERNGESNTGWDFGNYNAGNSKHKLKYNPLGRNIRTVWNIATHPFPDAHFATFPPKLVEPCVKAGCPVGGTVLDPFAGAGTTGVVALGLGRKFLGVELKPEYAQMAADRIRGEAPLFR